MLLLISLCAILLLFICCRCHALFSGFHCPCNMDKIFLSSFWASISFLKFPTKSTGLKGVWTPLPFSIPVVTDGCFHVAVAKSFLLLCSASISHQVAPHSPYKLKGKRSPCLSLLPISYLLRECFLATVSIYLEKSAVPHCLMGSVPALVLVHHQSSCTHHGY